MSLVVVNLVRPGLGPVSLSVERGACLAVRGASGAGKSLLMRAIADLDPAEGFVVLDGRDRSTWTAPDWRRQVAFIPAEAGWWAPTVAEHILIETRETRLLLDAVGLPSKTLSWSVERLSSGESQRLALVRALILNPQILLLDEPTSALDDDATHAVEDLLRDRMQRGVGVVQVTHSSDQADRLAGSMLTLDQGKVVT